MASKREENLLKLFGINPESLDKSILSQNVRILNAIKLTKPSLLGADDESLLVYQWFPLSAKLNISDFDSLDKYLMTKCFFNGHSLTASDIVIFEAVTSILNGNTEPLQHYTNLSRWLKSTMHFVADQSYKSTYLTPKQPTLIPSNLSAAVAEKAPQATTDKSANDKTNKKASKQNESSTPKDAIKESKTEKKANNNKATSSPEPSTNTNKDESSTDTADPSKLDIRVGYVVKCWNHPDSEKLLCEEIDLGEGSTRSIASGLRLHYSASDLEGRHVVVLANLKERPMAGFKSQGMVLCACNEDHTVVKLLDPPKSAKRGDRILFPGFEGEPATPAQVAKKKILEKLAPSLRTDADGVARWGDAAFTIGSEVCTAPLKSATVS